MCMKTPLYDDENNYFLNQVRYSRFELMIKEDFDIITDKITAVICFR